MNSTILDKLFAAIQQSKGIPALETTVASVLGAMQRSEHDPLSTANTIVQDFALTHKLLKLANSAMYAPFAKNAASVSSALKILGQDALLHVVLNTAVITPSEMENEDCLSKILLASELAKNLDSERSEDLSIAALMYDLGHLMTSRYLPDETNALTDRLNAGVERELAALEVFGMSHQQIGVEIAKRWHLPTSIISIIDGTGDPTLVGGAQFSHLASSLIRSGHATEVQQLVSKLSIPGIDSAAIAHVIHRKLEDRSPSFRQDRIAYFNSVMLEKLLQELQNTQWGTVDELAASMFAGLNQILKTAHCLLFLRIRTGDFKIRYGYGKGIDELRSKLRISATSKPTAFHAVIKNNVDVSITDVSKLKPSALPEGYFHLLPDINKMIILPIAHQSVTGLMYCDWDGDYNPSQVEMVVIRKLRNLFLPYVPSA